MIIDEFIASKASKALLIVIENLWPFRLAETLMKVIARNATVACSSINIIRYTFCWYGDALIVFKVVAVSTFDTLILGVAETIFI